MSTSLDARLVEHRELWNQKPTLRHVYGDYHRRLLSACPAGPLLDVGGGSGHIKNFWPDAVSVDILPFPTIDAVCDAHQLPFRCGHFAGIVMLDVLHHLERPITFLREAARVLRPGGVLALIEPGMSSVAYPFFRYIHQEPAEMKADPFAPTVIADRKDPFDSNQAIPTLLFDVPENRARLASLVPTLKVRTVEWLSVIAYPLSGGFKKWCLMPPGLTPAVLRFEDRMPSFLRRFGGFRLMVTLERSGHRSD